MTQIANFLNPQVFLKEKKKKEKMEGKKRKEICEQTPKEYQETWAERKVCEPFRVPLKAGVMPTCGPALFFSVIYFTPKTNQPH